MEKHGDKSAKYEFGTLIHRVGTILLHSRIILPGIYFMITDLQLSISVQNNTTHKSVDQVSIIGRPEQHYTIIYTQQYKHDVG